MYTLENQRQEPPKNGGLEDDVPFKLSDFLDSILIFRGVCFAVPPSKSKKKNIHLDTTETSHFCGFTKLVSFFEGCMCMYQAAPSSFRCFTFLRIQIFPDLPRFRLQLIDLFRRQGGLKKDHNLTAPKGWRFWLRRPRRWRFLRYC